MESLEPAAGALSEALGETGRAVEAVESAGSLLGLSGVAVAWLAALAMMTLVFMFAWWRTGSPRQAFIFALIWGKILATVLYLLGLDKPLFTITLVRGGEPVAGFTVTANLAILGVLAATNGVAYAWPRIHSELRREAPPLAALLEPPIHRVAAPRRRR